MGSVASPPGAERAHHGKDPLFWGIPSFHSWNFSNFSKSCKWVFIESQTPAMFAKVVDSLRGGEDVPREPPTSLAERGSPKPWQRYWHTVDMNEWPVDSAANTFGTFHVRPLCMPRFEEHVRPVF